MILPGRVLMPVIRTALERGQHVRMTVNGSSMLPFIRDNDVVELAPAPTPRLGDTVLVQIPPLESAERYVLHRIVRMVGCTTFYIRGDSQLHCEGPFTSNSVLGRIVSVRRHGRDRVLGHGFWRLAGLVWIRCTPCNLWLLRSLARVRSVGGQVVRKLQCLSIFRIFAKRVCPTYTIEVASQGDLIELYTWLSPNGKFDYSAIEKNTNSNLTNYVAKRGAKVLGLVRLMRHLETDFPHTGHWLYNLTVKTRYRGMGIGAVLTQRVIDQARLEGASELLLYVFENNAPAIALYRKLGFERVLLPALEAELDSDVQKYGRRRIVMRKQLVDQTTS